MKILGGGTARVEKKFGLLDNCYQMLSLSVIQCKEKERLVKRGGERRNCQFWMTFSTATWTLSPCLQCLCLLHTLPPANRQELKKVCL